MRERHRATPEFTLDQCEIHMREALLLNVLRQFIWHMPGPWQAFFAYPKGQNFPAFPGGKICAIWPQETKG